MNVRTLLWDTARADVKRALPILSFPAVQKLDATVEQLVNTPELMASAMEIIARDTDTLAAVSLMDLSVEAECFGAKVRFSDHEVPAVEGQLVCDMEEAEALTDRVGIMKDGRLLLCDTPAAIMQQTGEGSIEKAFIKIVRGEEK